MLLYPQQQPHSVGKGPGSLPGEMPVLVTPWTHLHPSLDGSGVGAGRAECAPELGRWCQEACRLAQP